MDIAQSYEMKHEMDFLRKNNRKFLSRYFLFQGTASLTFIVAFVHSFQYDVKVVGMHFIPILLVNFIIYYFLRFLLFSQNSTHISGVKFLSQLLVFIYLLSLSLIYSVNWISNSMWGSNVTLDFYLGLPRHIYSIAQLMEISSIVICSAVIIFLCAVAVIAKKIGAKLSESICVAPENPAFFNTISVVTILFLSSYITFTFEKDGSTLWRGEPISHLFERKVSFSKEPQRLFESAKDLKEKSRLGPQLTQLKPKTNIILVLSDALRADHMGVYGYQRETTPFLSSLHDAGQVVKVENATSTCSESACGILSSLSSREFQFIAYDLYMLNDLLRDVGYSTNFILSADHSLNFLSDFYGEDNSEFHDGRDHDDGLSIHDDAGIISKLTSMNNYDGTPNFFYFHLMSTHILSPDKGAFNAFQPAMQFNKRHKYLEHSKERMEKEINTYDNGILQLDKMIEDLLGTLKEKGYLENSLIVISSDHGEGLGERGNYLHTYHLYQEDIGIPLLFITSDQQDRFKALRYATQIDIAPTIADFLEVPFPVTWQGRSLLASNSNERYTFHQTIREVKEVAVIYRAEDVFVKLMATLNNNILEQLKLFDLIADPQESINIYSISEKALRDSLVNKLKSHFVEE
jgi:glucan phosphoethanolaminetransferase (alkaline phosphatase superfamily)